MKHELPCIDVIGLSRCTGCFACQSACPSKAIVLGLDAEGFYKPIVNRETCKSCGLCQHRCPVLAYDEKRLPAKKWPEPKLFAAWSLDDSLRLGSSSGGIFSELARPVIAAGGGVAGCVWGENWTPKHVVARTWAEVEKMRGSKYVPSQVGNVYTEILEDLRRTQAPVLFCGTPCQVAAMELALDSELRKRVLLVDIICHGVPSLRVFHKYLGELFKGERVKSYTFRDKSFGWQTVRAESVNQRQHHLAGPSDAFVAGFELHHLYVMASCHSCPFATLPRPGDVTLGDFWGCPEQWCDKRGVSLVVANSPAGINALEALRDRNSIALESTTLATATRVSKRLVSGQRDMPRNRQAFLDGLKAGKTFAALVSQYFPSKLQLSWNRFRSCKSKLRFLADFVAARLRRV